MLRCLLGWLMAVSVATAAAPVETTSDSPGGQLLAELLAAFNADDAARLDAFRERYGLKVSTADMLGFRDDAGPLRVLRIERDDEEHIVALIQPSSSDQVERIDIALTRGEPVKIESFTYVNAARPAEFALPRLSLDEAVAATAQRTDTMAQAGRFAGTVLLARHGEILLHRAWGLADREAGTRNALGTRFRLGSMNKMFTAVAILQLADAGKLSLADPVGTHLPDYPNRQFAEKVTIAHLLSHTGGAGDIFTEEFAAERDGLRTHDDYLELFGERAPEFEPGSEMRYANYGFVLLGAIVEKIGGQSYYDYVEEHIFEPAGMTRSGSLPESETVDGRAAPYQRTDRRWVSAKDSLPWRGMAAGGGYSTAEDIFRFATALQDGRLVSKDALARATVRSEKAAWYGQGFTVGGEGALRRYGHEGGAPGMNGVLHVFPESGYVVVVLSNLDPPAAERVAMFFENRMPLEP